YYLWGRSEFVFGNYGRSVRLLTKSRQITGPSPDLDIFLALSKLGLCDLAGALRDFQVAIDQDSTNIQFRKSRAFSLFEVDKVTATVYSDLRYIFHHAEDP